MSRPETAVLHPSLHASSLLAICLLAAPAALAQDYPTRVIRIVVAQAAASGPDLVARTIAQKLTESWGQQVIVINQPGASGSRAARQALHSVDDWKCRLAPEVART